MAIIIWCVAVVIVAWLCVLIVDCIGRPMFGETLADVAKMVDELKSGTDGTEKIELLKNIRDQLGTLHRRPSGLDEPSQKNGTEK